MMHLEAGFNYAVPEIFSDETVINMLKLWVLDHNGQMMPAEERTLIYFDNKTRTCLKNGMTVRRVSGFDPARGDGEKRFRYDFKLGPINTIERKEENHWSDTKHDSSGIYGIFGLNTIGTIHPTAFVLSTRYKWSILIEKSTIHILFDIFRRRDNSALLREIELELIEGQVEVLLQARRCFEEVFPTRSFPLTTKQKYTSLMDRM